MFIKTVLSRIRNDFVFISACEHCRYEHRRHDGYADAYFCTQVVPGQACPKCGKNSAGELVGEPENTDA